jgi:hypothetical protein
MMPLIGGKGRKWRARISAAILDAHRPEDNEFYTQWMSPETLAAWRDCMPKKRFDELTHQQTAELAENLAAFIFGYQRDDALRQARKQKSEKSPRQPRRLTRPVEPIATAP